MNDEARASKAVAEPWLRAVNLHKHYTRGGGWTLKRSQVAPLRGLDLELRRGSALALIGASGSGKSTLARCLAGLEKPDSGEIWVDGEQVGHGASRRHMTQLQLIFQDPAFSLSPRFTAMDIVSEPLLIAHWGNRAERAQRALDLIALVGLPKEAARRRVGEFSGGQRRRLAIARALALEPRALILDEALSGLDLSTQAQIANLLLEIQQARALTYLWISHDLSLVARLAGEIAVMDEGKIVETSPTREFFANPHTAAARHLLSALPGWKEQPS